MQFLLFGNDTEAMLWPSWPEAQASWASRAEPAILNTGLTDNASFLHIQRAAPRCNSNGFASAPASALHREILFAQVAEQPEFLDSDIFS